MKESDFDQTLPESSHGPLEETIGSREELEHLRSELLTKIGRVRFEALEEVKNIRFGKDTDRLKELRAELELLEWKRELLAFYT